LDCQIVVINFLASKPSDQVVEDARVLFASYGSGTGKSFLVVSIHKNFGDYMLFAKLLANRVDSFMISLETDDIVKHLSFSSLPLG